MTQFIFEAASLTINAAMYVMIPLAVIQSVYFLAAVSYSIPLVVIATKGKGRLIWPLMYAASQIVTANMIAPQGLLFAICTLLGCFIGHEAIEAVIEMAMKNNGVKK